MSEKITTDEVAKHNNNKSCWIIIHNDVYDVTKFLNEHPGGSDRLLMFAGQDGSQAFEDVKHSEDARVIMRQYKIGSLPEQQRNSQLATCCNPRDQGLRMKQTIECNACTTDDSNPLSGNNKETQKTWRTFDGSSDRDRVPHTTHKTATDPKFERRIQTIRVPKESNLKWYLLALAAAVLIGYALKKQMQS